MNLNLWNESSFTYMVCVSLTQNLKAIYKSKGVNDLYRGPDQIIKKCLIIYKQERANNLYRGPKQKTFKYL